EFHEVLVPHQVGAERAGKEEALRVVGMAHAHVAVGVDDPFVREDAVGDHQLVEELLHRSQEFQMRRAGSRSSLAVRPTGPRPPAAESSAAAPCRCTPRTAAASPGSRCARSAPSSPARTSPMPALAMPGLPLRFTYQRPPRAATMLPLPFSTACAFSSPARRLAASMRFACTSAVA